MEDYERLHEHADVADALYLREKRAGDFATLSMAEMLQQLPPAVFPPVLAQALTLVREPRPHGSKKLVGAGGNDWRVRDGEYWIVYEIDDRAQTIVVMRVAHRCDVYR
jgi:mRNA interferase RelE/StbE